jgi:hypothetical protein
VPALPQMQEHARRRVYTARPSNASGDTEQLTVRPPHTSCPRLPTSSQFFLFAVYVYRGGLDDYMGASAGGGGGHAHHDHGAASPELQAQDAQMRQLLRHQDSLVAQQQAEAAAMLAAAAAAAVVPKPAAAPKPAAPAPAAPAAPAANSKPSSRARPSPPPRPVLDDKAAPPLPPLKADDPKEPETPLSTVTFIDGGAVNVYPHELSERAGLKTLEERDWWPTVHKGWERDTQHALRAVLTKQKGATYIDFGSWIGPTVLFAGAYAQRIYALEPDIGAHREVRGVGGRRQWRSERLQRAAKGAVACQLCAGSASVPTSGTSTHPLHNTPSLTLLSFSDRAQLFWNVRANPAIAARTTVLNFCISNTTGACQ